MSKPKISAKLRRKLEENYQHYLDGNITQVELSDLQRRAQSQFGGHRVAPDVLRELEKGVRDRSRKGTKEAKVRVP